MTSQVLIVDADAACRSMLAELLSPQFMLVEAQSIAQARSLVGTSAANFQAVVTEAWLPDGDSRPFCTELSSKLCMPVIVMTSVDTADEAVRSLDAGASDHVLKPVRGAELRARLRAHLRSSEASVDRRLSLGHFAFYPGRGLILGASRKQRIRLTRKETAILSFLHAGEGAVISSVALDSAVWGVVAKDTAKRKHTLESHIHRLRRKLSEVEPHWRLLLSAKGGYSLAMNA